jgi:hypothetical protein
MMWGVTTLRIIFEGSEIVTVDPFSGPGDVIAIVPPCCSTMPFDKKRPMPVPGTPSVLFFMMGRPILVEEEEEEED